MASLKEIRTRIASVSSTRQITSAMKMVSASKLRRAQDAIVQMRPYANKLHEILQNISISIEVDEENPFVNKREEKKVLIVLIVSNKGLCGAFNANVVKKGISLLKTKYQEQNSKGNIDFITIGKKAGELLKSKNYTFESYNDLYNELTFDNVSVLSQQIMDMFADKRYDKVEIVYNQFKNAGVQIVQAEQFLPIEIDAGEDDGNNDYLFEPTKEQIVEELIPKSLKIQFYKAILDSHASEHGARMTAMHKATDNASDLIKELQLHYNKARQASITNEILEIVGGAEALKG